MGRRRPRAAFLPNVYVFPGGRLDRSDARTPPGMALRPEVEEKVKRRCRQSPASALALAALRETYEETGLLICGAPNRLKIGIETPILQAYNAAALKPDLRQLDYIARAITPPASSRRFNTRFFITRGDDAQGRLLQDGELLDLQWIRLDEASKTLKTIDVTNFVLKEAAIFTAASPKARASRRTPLFCYVKNKRRLIHE